MGALLEILLKGKTCTRLATSLDKSIFELYGYCEVFNRFQHKKYLVAFANPGCQYQLYAEVMFNGNLPLNITSAYKCCFLTIFLKNREDLDVIPHNAEFTVSTLFAGDKNVKWKNRNFIWKSQPLAIHNLLVHKGLMLFLSSF